MQSCGYYRPQTKLCIMVTSVCQKFCPQGGSVHIPQADNPPGRHPLSDTSPLRRHLLLGRPPLGRHPPCRRLLQWTVLECILVVNGFLLPMSMIGPFNCRSRPTKSLNEQQEGISVECQLPAHQQPAFHSKQV